MKTTRLTLLAIAIAALSTLVACGGGSSSSNPNPPSTGFTKASLKGNYTFFALGQDVYGPNSGTGFYEVGGVLVADGNGNITGGEQTYGNSNTAYEDTFTGTYSVNANGLTTITLNTGDLSIGSGSTGTETFAVTLLSTSSGQISQFDASATSSGTLDAQTSMAMPTAGYAFTVLGADVANNAVLSLGGVFNIDNNPSAGTISGAGSVSDIDDSGTLSLAQTLSGSVTAPDSFGRVFISLTAGFTTTPIVFDGYIVDSTHIRLVEDDSFGITGGTAIAQSSATGTFTSNSAFSGNFVYGFFGYNIGGAGADTGTITADGGGTLTGGLIDQNQAGTVISDTLSGTYAVDNTGTGRVVATTNFGVNGTGPRLIFYLTGNGNPVPMLQTDIFALASGTAYAQGSGTPSFNGTYGVGFDSIDTNFNESNGVAQITANGSAGNFSGTANINETFLPASAQTFNGTFSSFTGGRATGTITVNSGTPITNALYLIDSTQGFVIETDSTAVTLGTVRQQVVP